MYLNKISVLFVVSLLVFVHFRYLVVCNVKRRLFYNKQKSEERVPLLYNMNEPNFMIFAVPREISNTLNASEMPKSATIFYHNNRWWYELKTGKALDNELCQRENSFSCLKSTPGRLDVALGPFGKKFLFSSDSL